MTASTSSPAVVVPVASSTVWRPRVAAAALAIGAAALRFYQIDSQSLWYDEGVSAGMLGKGVAAITQAAAADFHPPLYYYLLVLWAHVFGDSVISLRGLTACFGVLLVVASWQLTTRLFGVRAGWLAGVWAAAAPLGVQYSQELRMYMPAAALVGVAAWCTVAWLDAAEASRASAGVTPPRLAGIDARVWLVGYVLAAAIALYLQYVAGFGLAAIGLYGLLRARGRVLAHWLIANVVALLLFAPWMPTFYHQMTVGQKATESAANGVVAAVVGSWLIGTDGLPGPLNVPAVGVMGLCVAIGLVISVRQAWRGTLPMLLIGSTLAGVTVYAVSRHVYEVHFILVALPAVAALGGLGLERAFQFGSRANPMLGASVIASLLSVLGLLVAGAADVRYLAANPHPNDNYHGLVQQIVAQAHPTDAILLYAPGQDQVFSYYYRGPNTVIGLPTARPPDKTKTVAQLDALAKTHGRIWVVEYGNVEADPSGIVTGWLAQHAFLASHEWFGSVQLMLYALSAPTQSNAEQPIGAHFTNGAQLAGYSVNAAVLHPGDTLALTLIWQADSPIADRYTVFTHLLDNQSKVVAQHDGEPAGGVRPTTTWKPGERIEDHHGLVIPANLAPGVYTIEVGMYIPQTGKRAVTVPEPGKPSVDRLLPGQVTVTVAS